MSDQLAVLLTSALAAAASALGILPFYLRPQITRAWVGWSSAVAAGLMLGTAWVLAEAAAPISAWGAVGAATGIGFLFGSRVLFAPYGEGVKRPLLQAALHSGAEGIALAAAFVLDPRIGLFAGVTLGIHKVPEGTNLSDLLQASHPRRETRAGLTVAANLVMAAVAVPAFLLLSSSEGANQVGIGFATGTLIYLMMADLLPGAYRDAGDASIALLTSTALSVVVFLQHLVPG